MIVEDEVLMAADIQSSLIQSGFHVTDVCSNPDEAVRLAGENRPHLAVMDIGLGEGLDGIGTALELKRRYDIPVVYLTGHTSPAIMNRAKASDPLGYLIKPFRDEDLRFAIELALESISRRLERDDAVATMWYHATHDPLSGLLNRTEFMTRATMIVERARIFHGKFRPGLVFLDVVGLRKINESGGLRMGDEALKNIGDRLRGILPLRDPACRWDGDFFAVLLNVCPSREEAEARAQSIVKAVEVALRGGPIVKVDYSFAFSEPGRNAEDLIQTAYTELCRKKNLRKRNPNVLN